jgi:MarR family transcriptional regulator, organic hydroperoxide resistance regulator
VSDPETSPPGGPDAEASLVPWELPRFRNWIAVAKVHGLVEKAMVIGLAPLELKLPHYEILANVYRFSGLTQQDLANRMLVGRSNLSMLLPELERRRLVTRVPDKDDRRLRRLSLTPEGRVLTMRALQVQVRVIEQVMEVLSADDCELLGDFMRRIGAHLLAKPAPAGEPQ